MRPSVAVAPSRPLVKWCTVVQTGVTLYPPLPAMSDRIRLTISVTPEVHEVFSRMAEAGGMSLGKCMGDWLADTAEGAQFVALKMEEARKAPKVVMREMQAMARGFVDEVDAKMEEIRQGAAAASRSAKAEPRRPARGRASPPSSNTGGKVPQTGPRGRGEGK